MTTDEIVLVGLVRLFESNGGLSDCAWDELERLRGELGVTTGPHRPERNAFVDERAASIIESRERADRERRAQEEKEAAERNARMEAHYRQMRVQQAEEHLARARADAEERTRLAEEAGYQERCAEHERQRLAARGLTPLSPEDRAKLVQEREARQRERDQEREEAEREAAAEREAKAKRKAERKAAREKEEESEKESARKRLYELARQWQRYGSLSTLQLVEFGQLYEQWHYCISLHVPLDFVVSMYRITCRGAMRDGKKVGAECLLLRQLYLDLMDGAAEEVGKANQTVWQALHPSEEQESKAPKAKTLPPPAEDDEEEDWRPLFLRGGVVRPGFHAHDEERAEEQGRYLETWLPYWREQFEHWVHLWEELEEPIEYWAHALEEPKERPKVTAALLRTFHNRNQRWRR